MLRFLAFGMVFLHHFFPAGIAQSHRSAALFQRGCEQGVQIFFLLSAYLITHLLLQEQERTSTVHVAAFYVRRILRIWPLYFFLILTAALFTRLHLSSGFPLSALTYFTFLSGNWYVVQHGWLQSAVAPLWTISVEEQFYLLWPLALRIFATRGLASLSVLFGIASYAMLIFLGLNHVLEYAVRANSLVEFQFFALGAGLALLLYKRHFKPSVTGRCLCLAAAILATYTAVSHFHLLAREHVDAVSLLGGYGLLALSTVCVFLCFLNAAMPHWAKPLIYLGRISYGLYAYHFIAFSMSASLTEMLFPAPGRKLAATLLHMVLAIALCVLMAVLSYNFLEKPFLRLKRKFTFVQSRDDMNARPRNDGRVIPVAA